MNNKTAILVLAAGLSRRFDGIKMIAELAANKPLLVHTLQQLPELPTFIACGQYQNEIKQALNSSNKLENCGIIYCPNASLGMGHTIGDAISFITQQHPNFTHVYIVLADQVALTSVDHGRMLEKSRTNSECIVTATFDKNISAPAIFPKTYFANLRSLTGDKGAKSIMLKNPDSLIEVDVPNAKFDIDTRNQLTAWHNTAQSAPK